VFEARGNEANGNVETCLQLVGSRPELHMRIAVLGFTPFGVGNGRFALKVSNFLVVVLWRKGKPQKEFGARVRRGGTWT
jgi:hypothetical protein